jgi:hypothetical protein
MDKSSFKFLFYIRKRMSLKPAEKLESDGHILTVSGHGFAGNGQKTLAILAEFRQGVVHLRTNSRAQNGRKQSKPSTSDSPEKGRDDLYDESECPGKGRNQPCASDPVWQ